LPEKKEVVLMRRLLVAMSLALVASLALSGVAFATTSATIDGVGQQRDYAAGSGTLAHPFAAFSEVSLGASSGPSGEDPQGFINLRNADFGPPYDGKGHVACLAVKDNVAVSVAEFENDSPFPGYPYALIIIEDNGRPNSAVPDRVWATGMAYDPEQITLEATCNLYVQVAQFLPLEPLESGNLTVHDATP
jgi:hypothetical protein